MKEFKGTKGEWRIEDKSLLELLYVRTDTQSICTLDKCSYEESYEAKANAKLIAASKDLLEALQGLMALRELIQPENTLSAISEEHEGEQVALLKMFRNAEQAIKKALN